MIFKPFRKLRCYLWMKNSLQFLIILVVFNFCTENIEKGTIDYRDPVLLDKSLSDLIRIKSLIPLQIPDSIIIGNVVSIEFKNEKILIHENGLTSSIMIFDQEGNFQSQFNKMGTGPGEYFNIDFFMVSEEEIIIYDRNGMNFLVYDFSDLSFLRNYKVSNYYVGGYAINNKNQILLISDTEIDETSYLGYQLVDSNFNELNCFNSAPAFIEGFLQSSIATNESSEFSLIQPFSESIFHLNGDFINEIQKIDFGKFLIPNELFNETNAEIFEETLQKGVYRFAVHNLSIGKDLISFNFFNKDIDTIELGLIDLRNGAIYRFLPKDTFSYYFFRPIHVRNSLNAVVLLPGEFDEAILKQVGVESFNLNSPYLIRYNYEIPD